MLLRFPSLVALQLSLTSGIVPMQTAAQEVRAASDNEGHWFIEPIGKLPAATLTSLKPLGVVQSDRIDLPLATYDHWLQIVPISRIAGELATNDKTVVLFDLDNSQKLSEIVAEILRLGNDRQSFRQLAADDNSRTLLRVIGPPYYALLRALESGSGNDDTRFHCAAYYEQRSRVWVRLGSEHPLAALIQPPPNKWLLLQSPSRWEMIDEAPFTDVYSVTEFQLSETASAWRNEPLTAKFSIPLRLASSTSADPAELWVLRDDPWQQVEQLISHSDNELVARLAFAVAYVNERPIVLVRVRPSKLPPPVLVLRGVSYRSYLKLPNLFLPISQRLHPPLRRDAVARLLSSDSSQIVWLDPQSDRTFVPRSVPDSAFRALGQWVDYVLDSSHEALSAWRAAHRFDFESFVCSDDAAARAKPPPKQQTAKPPSEMAASTPRVESAQSASEEPVLAEVVPDEVKFDNASPLPQTSELQQQLTRAEHAMLQLTSPPDSAERMTLWRELGRLNSYLERPSESALAWSHAFWEASPTLAEMQVWLRGSGAKSVTPGLPTKQELQEVIADPQSRVPAIRLATQVICAGAMNIAPPAHELLLLATQALEHVESALPVRLAWLAWVSLAKIAHRDALLLSRARDRLLERLFEQGLSPERDAPAFLRIGGGNASHRQEILRQHLSTLREHVAQWIQEPPGYPTRTRMYADLLIAYGLTSLGELAEGQKIVVWATQQIGSRDSLHRWALNAYTFRIDQVARGQRTPTLDRELLRSLEAMEKTDRYKADQLRKHSRIVEPFERIDPYRRWHRRYSNELDRSLALLMDERDPQELLAKLQQLLDQPPMDARTPAAKLRILTTALEFAPRLGAAFGSGLLARVMPAWNAAEDIVDRAILLEKGLQIAAHFDQREAVQAFVERFEASLAEIVRSYLMLQSDVTPQRQEHLAAIESLFDQSVRGFQKLGLRDEIGRIFGRIVELVHEHQKQPTTEKSKSAVARKDPTRASKLLLVVAGGWFHFGQSELAKGVIEDVRRVLFQQELPVVAKTSLACSYIAAIAQAPLEIAWPLIEELFVDRNLQGVRDNFATSTHFSLSQLDIVEATVLTLVSDVFVLSQETRLWLEEDEFFVRRKIHSDVREIAT